MKRFRVTIGAIGAALAFAALPAPAWAYQVQDRQVATSFDGTPIVYTTYFPDDASASNPVPVVLRTHGWGGSREKPPPSGFVKQLLDQGYGVLTWDSRGFGQSGGTVEIDDPNVEARDTSALIDVLANDPRVARDPSPARGVSGPDPVTGMSGGSYAGGIQWVSAARDPRIDAIAPEIAWHNLLESLIPEGVVKDGWGTLLYAAGQTSVTGGLEPSNPAGIQTGSYDPRIHQSFVEAVTTGNFSPEIRDWYASKGPDYLLSDVQVPTFIIQGSIDVLFPPSQGVKNYAALESLHPGQPLKLMFYCSGHGACSPFDSGPANYTRDAIVTWFDRYLKREDVSTGPRFEYVTDDGVWHGASDYPVRNTDVRHGSGGGVVAINGGPTASGLLSGSSAPASLEIPIPSEPGTLIGAPRITLTESGVGTATDQPNQATVFFQVVNKTKNHVVGNQITAKSFATDGNEHTYTFEIEPIAYTVDPGDQLVLEVASTSTSYEAYRGAAVVDLKQLQISIPELRGG